MMKLEIQVGSGALVFDKRLLKSTLRKAANEIANATRARISKSAGGGLEYRGGGGGGANRGGYKAGHYTASAPGESPVSVTGSLRRAIKVLPFKNGEGIAIRDTQFYALFLEAGAQGGVAGGGRTKAETARGVKKRGKRNQYKRGLRVGLAGARVLAPRPFLSLELAARAASIGDRLKAAVVSGLGWTKAPKKP